MKKIVILALCVLILAACSPTTTTTGYTQSGMASCTGWHKNGNGWERVQ
jgi:uncharacterized lipoprotein